MNKIELIELDEFNCGAGHIYSVAVDGADQTLCLSLKKVDSKSTS